MNKPKNSNLRGGTFSFRLAIWSLAWLVTILNSGILAQDAVSPAEARLPEIKQYETDKSENVRNGNVKLYSTAPSADLITAATYGFSPQSGVALDDMSSGTTQIVAAGQDDTASPVTNIGFDFWYDGVRYTQFSANANGLVRLGATAVSTGFGNSLASTTDAPKIAAYFDDLCTGTNGKVHYKVTGSAPNRKLTVEFLNMQITRGAGCAGVGNGTFQLWIYESAAAANPGVIQFVYGAIPVAATATDGGYSVGLQAGAATNFASVTTSSDTVSYTTANNANTSAITAGKSYIFTPNIPAAPTGISFTAVTPVGLTVNWSDNAVNEVGYAVYRSTDGTNFTFAGQTAANATSFTDAELNPAVNYFYRVYAVTEGALSSPPLTGNQTTTAAANDTCAGAGGNYSAAATWADGTVPTAIDNVTIQAGCTVTVDAASTALNLTVGSGGSLIGAAGTTLTVNRDLTNDGTLDFSPTNAATGTGLIFTSSNNNTFGGTGATTDILTINVNKGTSAASVLELTAANFTVQGSAADTAGFLTLTNGTFKLSGTFTAANRIFTAANYTIGATTGFWLNNPNFTVAGQNATGTVNGLFRVTQGTFNVGTAADNSLNFTTGANVIVEGGAINAAGRFSVSAVAQVITYNQSGGTITVNTVGSTSASLGSFDLGSALGSSITISGGTIAVQLAATIDYRNQAGSGTTGVTGGTLQLGNANSGAAKAYSIRGVIPNLLLTNTSANHAASFSPMITNYNNTSLNITVSAGTTLNFGNAIFLFAGATLTNNGTIVHNGTSSRFVTFSSAIPQSYAGSGVVTAPLSSFEVQSDLGFTFDSGVSQVVTNRVIVFVGSITNSNKLTIGNGGTTSATVQIGNTTTPTAAGTFDSTVTFNPGTGGIIISYLRTTASRVTGGEIPAARSITNLTYNENDTTHTLTVAGGDLIVTGTLTLTNGVVLTGANTLVHNGTAARTNGFVAGNLSRSYAATGAYTYFVGDNAGTPEYSPLTATVTALGTVPSNLKVSVTDAVLPGLDAAQSASRYWTLTETGDLTADLAFTYVAADVAGTASTYKLYKRDGGTPVLVPNSSTGINPATASGVSSFSDWGIGNLAPTAANTTAGGRVTKSNGRGIANALVTLTDSQGSERRVYTNSLGYYQFEVASGQLYIFTAQYRNYTFDQNTFVEFINQENHLINFVGTNIQTSRQQLR